MKRRRITAGTVFPLVNGKHMLRAAGWLSILASWVELSATQSCPAELLGLSSGVLYGLCGSTTTVMATGELLAAIQQIITWASPTAVPSLAICLQGSNTATSAEGFRLAQYKVQQRAPARKSCGLGGSAAAIIGTSSSGWPVAL